MKKISICIPTYSRLNYLIELVNSCLNQSYSDFEICISQDCTPKGLVQEIKEYCEYLVSKYPYIVRYVAQDKNLGIAGNWNFLVEMANGEYIFMPGDDDLIAPDFLEKMLAPPNLSADVIFCDQIFIDSNGEKLVDITIELNYIYKRDILLSGIVKEPVKRVLQNSIPMSSAIIKRICFLTLSFDNRINTPELEVFLKIALGGGKFIFVNEQLAFYRMHQGSATSSGLSIGQFLSNIMDIEIPEEYFSDKYKLIINAIVPGINNALSNGNVEVAKKLYNSEFYPRKNVTIRILQGLLLLFPNYISKFILDYRKSYL
ncbi:glycosyltransferase [Flavobacterium galactosidilyticum]|uniref:glycosyltransferase family 2 protein n=1 Tax=Flavobacterium galactosidilyticum TaxID=2893886 RepID=UPI001E5446CF|nr:glycosyltransferase family 2 protein [Flavobacterium sp. F-340]UFH45649.1 glycosyltransferase [Flavobacterium sp. F-340]